MMWQPIETAPKDGTAFLACSVKKGLTNGDMAVVSYSGKDDGTCWEDGTFGVYADEYFTHWMPLPPPLEAE